MQRVAAWVRIAPDGNITISHHFGDGPGLVELDPADSGRRHGCGLVKGRLGLGTGAAETFGLPNASGVRAMAINGSRRVTMYYSGLRVVGAQVRKILLMNAAEKWGVIRPR